MVACNINEMSFLLLVTKLSSDNFWDKGAGYFNMEIGDMVVEVMGRRGNLSLEDPVFSTRVLPKSPTKIKLGPNYWASTVVNPGMFVRGHYIKDFLRHVQSWR